MASEVAQDAVNAANKFRNVPPVSNIETKYPQLLFTNICPSDHPYLISATSVVSTTIHLNKSGNSALVDIHSTGRWGRLNQSDNPNYEKDLLGTTLSACCECDSSKA